MKMPEVLLICKSPCAELKMHSAFDFDRIAEQTYLHLFLITTL